MILNVLILVQWKIILLLNFELQYLLFSFWNRASVYPWFSWNSIGQADLKLRDPSASVSTVLGIKNLAWIITFLIRNLFFLTGEVGM